MKEPANDKNWLTLGVARGPYVPKWALVATFIFIVALYAFLGYVALHPSFMAT